PEISEQTPAAEEAPKVGSTLGTVIRRVFGQSADTGAIKVKGYNDLLVYRARCCNPIRGEAIVGYVTRGKGVAVHAVSCPNVNNLMYEADRRIAVEWAKPLKVDKADRRGTYPVKLTVFCDDRPAMLKQLTAVISDDNTNIRNIEARTADSQATIDIVIDIEDVKHLERVIGGLRKIPGIHDVQRLNKV
ncbi:MAG TPA: ACT domain-containing protein, partial [Candidatus Angelobacter sp.]